MVVFNEQIFKFNEKYMILEIIYLSSTILFVYKKYCYSIHFLCSAKQRTRKLF